MNQWRCEKKQSWSNVKYHPGKLLRAPEKGHGNHRYRQSARQNLKAGPPEAFLLRLDLVTAPAVASVCLSTTLRCLQ
jgi:hypothetical protein